MELKPIVEVVEQDLLAPTGEGLYAPSLRIISHMEIDDRAMTIARELDGISMFQAQLILQRVKSYITQYSTILTKGMSSDLEQRLADTNPPDA
jgi:hypothetical protein